MPELRPVGVVEVTGHAGAEVELTGTDARLVPVDQYPLIVVPAVGAYQVLAVGIGMDEPFAQRKLGAGEVWISSRGAGGQPRTVLVGQGGESTAMVRCRREFR